APARGNPERPAAPHRGGGHGSAPAAGARLTHPEDRPHDGRGHLIPPLTPPRLPRRRRDPRHHHRGLRRRRSPRRPRPRGPRPLRPRAGPCEVSMPVGLACRTPPQETAQELRRLALITFERPCPSRLGGAAVGLPRPRNRGFLS